MLEKITLVDLIEIVESGVVQVRTKTVVMEDGNQISSTYHRHIITPGQDYSKESDRVKTVCASIHTPQLIQEYEANKKPVL